MDHNNNVCLVEEEEKSGWTILSTVHDEELGKKLSTSPDADLEPNKGSDESVRCDDDSAVSEEKNKEENEDSDDAEEVLYSEGDDDADDELTDYGVDEGAEEEEGSPFGDSARGYVWESEPVREVGAKQTLVEHQPGQKQGLIWRVSLIATLGFFGWAVLSGFGGGGKNIRCLKLHPCSLKEGEPVLSTL